MHVYIYIYIIVIYPLIAITSNIPEENTTHNLTDQLITTPINNSEVQTEEAPESVSPPIKSDSPGTTLNKSPLVQTPKQKPLNKLSKVREKKPIAVQWIGQELPNEDNIHVHDLKISLISLQGEGEELLCPFQVVGITQMQKENKSHIVFNIYIYI